MDEEIDELKSLVKKNLELTQETNHMVHKMRRAAVWGRFFQIAWWVAVIAVSGAAYYYLQPYIRNVEQLYSQLGVSTPSSPGISQGIQSFLQNLTHPKQ